MPTPLPAGLRLGTAEPAEAVAAFQDRGLLAPTFNWFDVWQQEHARAFMVSGVAQSDVLALLQDALREPLRQGKSVNDFIAELQPQLQAKGFWGDVEVIDPDSGETRISKFDERRLRLIYDTNLRQSYAAGRWARIERSKKRLPFIMYRTMGDERVRASHAAWNNLVLPVDHPFWDAHYPQNAWRCRCTAFALAEKDIERRQARGERIVREAPPDVQVPYVDRRTGETRTAPLGVDPAFAYNPGKAHLASASDLQRRALDSLPPPLASAQVQRIVRSGEFKRFIERPVPGEQLPVGLMAQAQARALGARTQTVLLSEQTVVKQARRHPEVSAEDYLWVQQALDAGERIADGAQAAVYLLERDGWVAVVKATRTGAGLFLTSFRRISSDDARRSEEVRRLQAKAGRSGNGGGADGGAPQSA